MEKEALINDGYSIEVNEKDRKNGTWEVVDDHVVEEGVEREEIDIRGFDFNLFDEDRDRCVGEDMKEFTYLLMIIKLWPGYWEEHLDQMDNKVDEYNGRGRTQENGQFRNLWQFQGKNYGGTLGGLFQHPPLALGGPYCERSINIQVRKWEEVFDSNKG